MSSNDYYQEGKPHGAQAPQGGPNLKYHSQQPPNLYSQQSHPQEQQHSQEQPYFQQQQYSQQQQPYFQQQPYSQQPHSQQPYPQQPPQSYPQQQPYYPQTGYGPQPPPQNVYVQQDKKSSSSMGCWACLAGMCFCCCAEELCDIF